MSKHPTHVAVIGAGISGLMAIRHLVKAGLKVSCFEQNSCIGGLWNFQPLEQLVDIRKPHVEPATALYKNLRTNFPLPFMTIPDSVGYPENTPLYPLWQTVQQYLEDYASHYQLLPHIRFQTRVTDIAKITGKQPWQVSWSKDGKDQKECFDKVVICNGHNSKPVIPKIAGLETFKGLVTHSLFYREPEPFKNQNVAILGISNSGEDLSLDLSQTAKHVYLCGRTATGRSAVSDRGGLPYGPRNNITQHPEIISASGKTLVLKDGTTLKDVDTLLLTTGYNHGFPFFPDLSAVGLKAGDRFLSPLYIDTFHADDSSLAFIGLPAYTAIFWLAWYQSIWIAKVFSNQLTLPDKAARNYAVRWQIAQCQALGLEERHYQVYKERQFPMLQRVARMAGESLPNAKAESCLLQSFQHRVDYPDNFRDIPFATIPPLKDLGLR
ncbi:NAD(P)-binding domain-containing protein [Parendozoicomonas haliclonae]|uniref:NAD(P)-binding domain-containing protein n=1 Tax=Parendozoicomonas haliclonae TaxID=1960125 RepID=UPI000B352101|nr:NAD(P)-binding domain-containing protein [Parendozoicomonas haliclonae]